MLSLWLSNQTMHTWKECHMETVNPGGLGTQLIEMRRKVRLLLKLHIMKSCYNGFISRNHVLVLQQLGTNLFL